MTLIGMIKEVNDGGGADSMEIKGEIAYMLNIRVKGQSYERTDLDLEG